MTQIFFKILQNIFESNKWVGSMKVNIGQFCFCLPFHIEGTSRSDLKGIKCPAKNRQKVDQPDNFWCRQSRDHLFLQLFYSAVEGRVCLYNCSYSSRSLPALEEILELDCACQEDTNLENFFTEYLICMCGTLFWGSKFHSQ